MRNCLKKLKQNQTTTNSKINSLNINGQQQKNKVQAIDNKLKNCLKKFAQVLLMLQKIRMEKKLFSFQIFPGIFFLLLK